MKNIKLIVEYDGNDFFGYQDQPGLRTVEGELKKALREATKEEVKLISAGRTDRGVHALGQVVNFKTRIDIPGENYKLLMDFLLPRDITIKDSYEVGLDFHSRFDAKKRRYKYYVYNRYLPHALYRGYSYHIPYDLDLDRMREASSYFIGTKDFSSFKLTEDLDVNPIRTIDSFQIERQGDLICFTVEGRSFLHNMVRIMVGTLLSVGRGQLEPSDLARIIEARDRREAGITAGAEGLYLEKVFYE